MLHILNQPLLAYSPRPNICRGDTILLTSDACYSWQLFVSEYPHCEVLALAKDVTARMIDSPLSLISDTEWVELVISANKHISW